MMRKLTASVLCLALLLSLYACGSAKGGQAVIGGLAGGSSDTISNSVSGNFNGFGWAGDEGSYDYDYAPEAPADNNMADHSDVQDAATGRKLIKTASIQGETREYDTFRTWLESAVMAEGGYFESMNEWKNEYGRWVEHVGTVTSQYREMDCVVRLPSDRLDAFMGLVGMNCNVVRTESDVRDVTLSYVDLESHRDALETEQGRLMELLAMAESLDDVLALEDRLSQVRYQLSSYESQLRVMDNQVDYGTLSLRVSEVKELTEIAPAPEGFFETLIAAFKDGAKQFGVTMESVAFWAAANILWLITLAIAIFAVRGVAKKAIKRVRKGRGTGRGFNMAQAQGRLGDDFGAVSGEKKDIDEDDM